MNDVFTLIDSKSAQLFLQTLPVAVRRKGESLFRRGKVENLQAQEPGTLYSGQVLDGPTHDVNFYYDAVDGWGGNCSCQRGGDCEHVYATMSALLAENRAATVRNLSSTSPSAIAANAAARPVLDPNVGSEVARRLAAALGRNLNREEFKYVASIHAVYLRCKANQRLTGWDLAELGFPFNGNRWEHLQIWPSFPAGEHEFWLYIAYAAKEQNFAIPSFMEPISNSAPMEERLTLMRRNQEVEEWKARLAYFDFQPRLPVSERVEETDLRLVFGTDELRLQHKPPGQPDFDYLRPSRFRNFAEQYDLGHVHLSSEAELIWQFFATLIFEGLHSRYGLFDSQTSRRLGRLLRTPQLESRIVNWRGQPLTRMAEPLRWNVESPANEKGDYRLRLVQANGNPAPPFLCVLPGRPALCVTEETVFKGPWQDETLLDPTQENRIPAAALEIPSGVEFLRTLGVELPSRIRDRLHLLPFQIAIDCNLRRPERESNVEECAVSIRAEASNGHQLSWNGSGWNPPAGRSPQRNTGSGPITVYDRSVLDTVPALIEPLNLKPSPYGQGLAVKVTKKFPELFANWLKTVPPGIILRLGGELASLASPDVAGRVTLSATEAGIDWFDLRVVLDISDTTLSASEIKVLLNAKGGYVRLEGKGWRRLKYNLSDEEDERLARLGLSARELTAEPQRLHALQLADDAAKKFLPQQQVAQIQRRVTELKTRVTPDLPRGVTAQLRPYQLQGFHFLAYLAANRFGGILADDMGLGKTVQTLAWLLWLRESGAQELAESRLTADTSAWNEKARGANIFSSPSLVVCPKSVTDNWKSEAMRFTPALRVKVWSAGELDKFEEQLASADLHVLNYSQIRLIGERLMPIRWLAVILDEGQYIKNPGSQTAQVARGLASEYRLILSGTPIENRLLDLWSLMSFAMPGVLGTRAQFARVHDAKGDPFARRRLAARVRPFVLRRTKAQVATDLPDRIEEDLLCEIEGEQQTLYRAELKRAQQLLLGIKTQKELAQQQFHFLTSLLRLRQICCDPRLVKSDAPEAGAKMEALLDLLEPIMEEGQKVLVFSQFVELLQLVRPALAERNWPLFYLAGDTENRGALVEQFQKTEGPAIFLISLKAGGFGLNLTAASYVVLFDPWWNPAVENQAIDRTHRIGQTNKIIAYRLLIKSSIEEKIRELQKQKKAMAHDVLGEEKFAQSLTLEDLHFLFAN